ncbi:uncharacterized protein LOC144438060 [Glandiceps talaboti]
MTSFLRRDLVPSICIVVLSLVLKIGLNEAATGSIIFNENCNSVMNKKDANYVRSHSDSVALSETTRCTMTVQAKKNNQFLYIRFVFPDNYIIDDPRNTVGSDGLGDSTTCDGAYIQIYDSETRDNETVLVHTCGTTQPASVATTQNFATFYMRVRDTSTVNFTILYSSYDFGPCTDEVTELQCNNGRCIPRSLACDFANNCGDSSDQLVGAPSYCPLIRQGITYDDLWWWWIPIVALLFLYAIYWCCWRPGYFPWRMACCRNVWRDMCRDCCKHCCTDCRCGKGGGGGGGGAGTGGKGSGGGGGKGGRGGKGRDRKGCTCLPCCRPKDEAYKVTRKGKRGKGRGKGKGNKGGDKRSDHVILIDEDGTVRSSPSTQDGGGIFGDYMDFYNDEGQHARESR